MSDLDNNPNKYNELRSNYKYYIDSYNALYQLKTENEEDLNLIYKIIKTELIDSKKYLSTNAIMDILNIIPYNNHYTKSYLSLIKLISDDYHVKEVSNAKLISNFLFFKEYTFKLDKSNVFEKIKSGDLDIHIENTIYRAIIYNDKERVIFFTERDGFDKNQKLKYEFYPVSIEGLSLLELCCYHSTVDCYKLLRSKFNSEITQRCLKFSFLGGNQEIVSECLKYQKPDEECMKYAIISHNNDFVTFLMNEYNIQIDLYYCGIYNNLESFLVYFDQTNDFKNCFIYSAMFNIPSLCGYFLSFGANINDKDDDRNTALHYAAGCNCKEVVDFLISHGANIHEKDEDGNTSLHKAAEYNSKETTEALISFSANIDEKNIFGNTALHNAALKNCKETAEILISHGANINEKDEDGETALHYTARSNNEETAEILISHGANINEKDKCGNTALHMAVLKNSKETIEVLISHGANINEKNNNGETALHYAALKNNKETVEFLISHGANVSKNVEIQNLIVKK